MKKTTARRSMNNLCALGRKSSMIIYMSGKEKVMMTRKRYINSTTQQALY